MKRIIKFSILFSVFFILCGFKHVTIINVKDDNSVNIEVDLLVKDTTVYEEQYNQLSDGIKSYEGRGFKIIQYNKDNYKGYKLTKVIDNINNVSKNKNEEISISNILDKNFYFNGLFSLNKHLFKNTYSAKYKYEFNESKYLNENHLSVIDDEVVTTNKVASEDDINVMSDMFNNTSEYELSLIVKLPHKVKTSNASEFSNDSKTLTWVLDKDGVANIEFSYEEVNKKNIVITSVSTFTLLIVLFVVLVLLRKKKSTKDMLICTSFDPSIAGQINETTIKDIPKSNNSLELSQEK